MPKEKYFVDNNMFVRLDIWVHIYITIDQKTLKILRIKNHKWDILASLRASSIAGSFSSVARYVTFKNISDTQQV
jgi:hypothetical protein